MIIKNVGVGSCLTVVRSSYENKSMNLLESHLCYKDFDISGGVTIPFQFRET